MDTAVAMDATPLCLFWKGFTLTHHEFLDADTLFAMALGKSRGGLSTKIHAVDALGNPVRLILTPGQASEYGSAPALLGGLTPKAVLGDKGYDSDRLRHIIQAVGPSVRMIVIPSDISRKASP